MSRKGKEGEGDGGDVIDVAILGLGDLASKYHAPGYREGDGFGGCRLGSTNWTLPPNAEIIRDFERCGSQLGLYLEAVLPTNANGGAKNAAFAKQLLLSAIVLQLKTVPEDFKTFEERRNAGEDARLMLLEENAYEAAEFNPAAIKFLLEKRRGDRFGRATSKEGDDEKTQALKELSARLKASRDR